MTTLADKTILVTRPGARGAQLCAQLQIAGAHTIHLPTIDFAPPADEQTYQQALQQVGEQDWLIFISPQAVIASIVPIRRQWPSLPPSLQFAAVGAGTVQALQAAGIGEVLHPSTQWSSEGLLALPVFQQLRAKKIMLVRGEGGRALLAETLTARGAVVTHCIAYKRIVPTIDIAAYAFLFDPGALHAIVCASYDSVAHLKILCTPKYWSALRHIPLVVVSERIQMLAQQLGFQTIWVAANASHDAIIATLKTRIA